MKAMTIFGHRPPPTAAIGLVIVALNLLMAVFGPWLAPYEQSQSVSDTWSPASLEMWLGADQIGRDMLTRLIYGARTTIGIAAATTVLSFFIGITFGLIAAVMGAWVDMSLSRLVDVILSIPSLILALIILGVFGSSIPVLIVTIAILDSTRVFRLARALGKNLTVLEFVEAARLRGEGLWWIISREILPNAAAPLISEFGLRFCFNFLFVATLSFLGIGVQPPYADWGGMVRENAAAINFGIFAPLYPAFAIATLTVGVNLVVDWLLSIDARPSGSLAEM
jgi:peptide/nickel transport system permease protein